MSINESPNLRMAQRLALAVPALLLAGAYLSQYGFDLYPCEMCWWQRYPHFAAVAFALLSFLAAPKRLWIALAAGGLLTSGLIGLFHAGVEYGWWEGVTSCAAIPQTGEGQSALDAIMNAPVVRCDEAPWTLLGISLAGFNFLISTATSLFIFNLLRKEGRS
ncbi:disulfide bond formation protein B [Qipengyuania huizhouensis]|uniref:disulfide bond formation protein B n=1 Tax=Qipengyuania huizhouensis TaxID=2867245 RepID=UPI0017990CAE|nr:disulfide bond formation protein B [Erythrobacter sp.]MBL4858991.1 disulfide bond formation protein B [Erythrobacter sp.]MBX7459967.1 disulfide bond formation protein B [Qipengyuania huizhouensis]